MQAAITSARGLATLVLMLVLAPAPAFAYLDPGTGSFLFQAVAAGIISVAFIIKAYWRRLRDAWTGRRDGEPPRDVDS